jgi:hypothetical protein
MTALSESVDRLRKYDPKEYRDEIIGADSTQFFKGSLVGLVAGKATKLASTTAAVSAVYVCEDEVLTGVSNTRKIGIRNGIHKFAVTGGMTLADVGKICYVADDNTVTLTGAPATEVVVGTVQGVDAATDIGGAGAYVQLIGLREAIPTAAVVTG